MHKYFLGLLLTTLSCGNSETKENENKIVVEFSNIDGLTIGDKIQNNGVTIGNVNDIGLSKNGRKVFVTALLKDEIEIPENSEFYMASLDILGTKGINVKYSKSNKKMTKGDTVLGLAEKIDTTYFQNILETTEKLIKSTDSLIKQGEIDPDSLSQSIINRLSQF
ncbi:MAG: MlaD family protein [Crocinitomicaceae bacterium]|nr:MlaD family protein [Crocinitomicaceae bacterium]